MSDCMAMGEGYQPLVGLQDIKTIVHLNQEAVRDILRASTRDSELQIVTMGQLTDMSGTNDAFNSSICSLEVTASLASGKDDEEASTANGSGDSSVATQKQKTFHFVIKSPPKATFIKMMHKMTKPFLNEVTWYLELLRQVSLAEACLTPPLNSPDLSLTKQCPVVYHAHSNYYSGEVANSCAGCPWFCSLPFRQAEEGILVMENVKKRGFVMFDKMRILPLDHFLLAMTNLAHFHGRWLVYRWMVEQGQLGTEAWTMDELKSACNTQKRPPKLIYKQLLSGTAKTVKRILELEGKDDLIEKVSRFFTITSRRQLDLFMGNVTSSIDTLCHGDFWSNNIMFKYDEEGKVNGTILVDFQLINYGHPAYDLMYLLYLSTDTQFRDMHMGQCLHHYWDTLTPYITQFQPKGFKYDWQDFQTDIETYKSIGYVMATTLMPNVLSTTQLEPGGLLALKEMQRKQAAELEDSENLASKEIKRRIVGLTEELVRDKVI
jgi:hypothetical protein